MNENKINEGKKDDVYMYMYGIVLYDRKNNESDEVEVMMMIKRGKNVRGFSFNDENGEGYIYPIGNDDEGKGEEEEEEMNEYQIEGECTCCYECMDDNDCGKENEMCNNGKCLSLCKNNDECDNDNNNQICSDDGNCIDEEECRYDNECKRNEICNWNGKCINNDGDCNDDDECNDDELCINQQCSLSSCRNNFDCNDYNHVCIDNECIFINDNTESCTSDSECGNKEEDDYYCDYEYFICIKLKKESMISVRRKPTGAVICSLYGLISIFVITSSYYSLSTSSIIKNKLIDECINQCSMNYRYNFASSTETKVKNIVVKESKQVKRRTDIKKQNSQCYGKCRVFGKLKTTEAITYGGKFCPTVKYTQIVTIEDKVEYFKKHNYVRGGRSHAIFQSMLTKYCKTFKFGYFYIQNRHYTFISSYKVWKESHICCADVPTIECSPI